jgi:hypothetical protein
VAGRKAELPRRLLLQGRGGEGRRRIAREGLGLDRRDGETAFLDRGAGALGSAFVADGEAVDLAAFEARQAARNSVPSWARVAVTLQYSCGLNSSISRSRSTIRRKRDGLDAAGRLGAGELAPQDRREGEADQIIERAAGAVGVDQILVELAGLGPSRRSRPTW